MSWKQFLQVWGFTDKEATVEEVKGSLPTAGWHDDGAGWTRTGGGSVEDYHTYQREVRTTPPPASERGKWQEHAPGVWHKKGD